MIQKIKRFLPAPLEFRLNCQELMDDLQSDRNALYATLDQFVFINRWLSRSRTLLIRYIFSDMLKRDQRSYTLVDIGAGGCDISAWLIGFCEKKGISLSITCIDHDPRVITYARKHYGHLSQLNIVEMDVRTLFASGHTYDYIFANHFLHHLDDEHIVSMLRGLNTVCRYRYLINDLQRSKLSYVGYSLGAALLFRHSFAFADGRLSIRRGFLRKELVSFCEMAGLKNARVGRIVPGRLFVYN
ncbi:MAG: methyltransferase domain-containing protein [Fibrobacterota bacterium]